MKRRISAAVLALFVGLSIAVPIAVASVKAQTALPCPENCKVKNLQAEFGDYWYAMYILLGCWQLPESCTGIEGDACVAPAKAPKGATPLRRPRLAVR